jgi:chorismate mutase
MMLRSSCLVLYWTGVWLLPRASHALAAWSPYATTGSTTTRSTTSSALSAHNHNAALHGESATTTTETPLAADVNTNNNIKTIDVLSLASIRSTLIRQEETIIFALIERAQYRLNQIVYDQGGFGSLGTPVGSTPVDDDNDQELSFLEYMLVGTEALHCGVRRYTSPEEHAFFPERLPGGPMEALPSIQYPQDLLSSDGGASAVNFNKKLLRTYVQTIAPSLAKRGDDEQHGSTVLADIAVLQALSRRIHYGKFVAESK